MSFFSALLASGGFNPVSLSPYFWMAGSRYNSSTGAWTDLSTNARNGTQVTSGKRPTTTTDGNGNILLVTDGTDDFINSGFMGDTLLNGSCSIWIFTQPADGQPAGDQTLIGTTNFEVTLKTNGSIYVRLNNATDGAKIAQTISGVYSNGSQVMNLIRVDINFALSQIFIYVGNTICLLDTTNNGDLEGVTAANFTSTELVTYLCRNNVGAQSQYYAGNTSDIYALGYIPTLAQSNALLTYFASGSFQEVQTPLAPTSLVLTGTNFDAVSVGWTDNANNEDGYEVYRSLNNTTWTKLTTTAANVNSYSDSGLTQNTLYYYRVRAKSQQGRSAYLSGSVTTPSAASLNEFLKFVAADVNLADPLQVRVSGSNFLIKGIDQGTALNDLIQNTNANQGVLANALSNIALNHSSSAFSTQSINGAGNWTNGDFEIWLKCQLPISNVIACMEGIFVSPNGIQIFPGLTAAGKLTVRLFGSAGNKDAQDTNLTWAAGSLPSNRCIMRITFTWATKQIQLYKCDVGAGSLPQLTLDATKNGNCSAINYIGISTASLYHINGYSTAGTPTSRGNNAFNIYDRRVFNRLLTSGEASTLFGLLNI